MQFFGRVGEIVRATLDRFRHATGGWSFVTGRSRINFAGQVGDGTGSSVVMACVNAICTAFPEAPLEVRKRTEDGWEAVPDHDLVALIDRPNAHMSGRLLWWATLASLHLSGDAYWIKVRSGANRVVELWPVFPHLIDPVWRDNDWITAYEYRPGQEAPIYLDPADVVHFRLGVNPANPRKGFNPLASLYREIFTDLEAGEFTSQLLVNLGIPGVIISPSETGRLTQEDADAVKARFVKRFSGDGRGEPLVMSGGTTVSILSFSPEQMDLKALRRVPEERICAVLGVPAIVAGLGAGLDRSTYSNMQEARESFYETKLIPLQGLLCDEIRAQLLYEFADVRQHRIAFDLSQIRILQEDEDKKRARIRADVAAGIMTVNEARTAIGLEPDEKAGDIYLRPSGVATVPWNELPQPKPAPLALLGGQPEPGEGEETEDAA